MFRKKKLPEWVEPGTRGIVFATTGKLYTDLARRAARTIRTVMPDAAIDLFTDQGTDDPVFDRVHRLDETTHRPKLEALRRTRFERTILLDSDIIVLADISDMFEALDRYDMAGSLGVDKTPKMTPRDGMTPICLNPINTGVLAVKASPKTQAFVTDWENDFKNRKTYRDQPAFRRMLHQSNLDFVTLGPAYNCIWLELLDIWRPSMGAPRILHVRRLHEDHNGDPETPFDLVEAIGAQRARHVENLLQADWMLGGDLKRTTIKTPNDQRREKLRRIGQPAQCAPEAGKPLKRLRKELNAARSQIYRAAILALAHQDRPMRICIVGANDGKIDDPLYPMIRENLRDKTDVILFEPQEYLLPILAENYSFHPCHRIVPAAVGQEGTLTLHAIRPQYWDRFHPPYAVGWPSYRAPTGITSFDRTTVLSWVGKHLPGETDPDKLITELTVPCNRLVTFLADLGREPVIDVLQVDAEGFDDEVIYACDLHLTQPKIITFEKSNLPPERLERLKAHLRPAYELIELQKDYLAIRRTTG